MAARRKSTKAWRKVPDKISVEYYRAIRLVSLRIRKTYTDIVEPELGQLLKFEHVEVPNVSMDDSVSEKIGRLFRKFRISYYGVEYPINGDPNTRKFRNQIELKVEKEAKAIARTHKQRYDANQNFVLGVDPLKREPWLKPFLADWTAENVRLIKGVPEFAVGALEQTITQSVLRGDSQTFLKSQIAKILKDTDSRVALIARDQSSKLYGSLTKLRAQFNGWDFYEWDTVDDERVRPDHRRLNGKIFKFSEPPITVNSGKRDGERNNPGQDINCRCVALVIFDQNVINRLVKQQDGSYRLPETKQVA